MQLRCCGVNVLTSSVSLVAYNVVALELMVEGDSLYIIDDVAGQ